MKRSIFLLIIPLFFVYSCSKKDDTSGKESITSLDKELRICWPGSARTFAKNEEIYFIDSSDHCILEGFDIRNYDDINEIEMVYLVQNRSSNRVQVDLYNLTDESRILNSDLLIGNIADDSYQRFHVVVPKSSFPRYPVDLVIRLMRKPTDEPFSCTAYPECLIIYRL